MSRGRWGRCRGFRLLAVCAVVFWSLGGTSTARVVRAADLGSYDFVHDPSMIKEGRTYYVFSTGAPDGAVGNGNVQIRTSTDLRHWRYRGTVFEKVPGWVTGAVGPIPNLWAPDISFWAGRYHL